MKQSLLVTFAIVFSFVQPTASFSQWAVEVGASYNIQSGSFRAPCGCIFPGGGKGAGFTATGWYDVVSLGPFSLGVEPGFDLQTYTAWEVPGDRLSGDQINIQMRYLTFGPYVRYEVPGSRLFFQFSPEADYLISNSYQHISHPVPDPTQDIDSSMGDLRSMRYAARVSAGYKFNAFGLEFAPIFTVDVPFNNIRADYPLDPTIDLGVHGANNWRLTSIDFSIAVFF
jgi:hypothetical protein